MKPIGITLAIVTLAMIFAVPVEAFAQHDALGPVLGLTILLAAVAAGIFAWPVRSRR